ncbi:MAG: VapC toxin family PIN domain ribonuclease [Psychromonas sp.]|nr:VapC toxin family PIN domain ribonuclease [Psychromonas sp.]
MKCGAINGLVDASICIYSLNCINSLHSDALDLALANGTAAIGDIIFLEILQGFKSDKDYKNTKAQLSKLNHYEMFGQHRVNLCASNYRYLRMKGVTISSTAGVIISIFCIENKFPLFFKDKDFTQHIKYLGLLRASLKT